MAMAISAFLSKQISRIVLVRPAVEAGEKLGFLPGDIAEKVSPYLRPLYDALFDMMEIDKASKLIERGIIEIAPLAFMRGRTLNDSFVILDEAQNTTPEQMKMYLTRLGFGSKTVVTGDITQIDLPPERVSGLVEAIKILKNIEDIKIVYFSERDVVRTGLYRKLSGHTKNMKNVTTKSNQSKKTRSLVELLSEYRQKHRDDFLKIYVLLGLGLVCAILIQQRIGIDHFLGSFLITSIILLIFYRDIKRYKPVYLNDQKMLLLLGLLVAGYADVRPHF